MLRWIFFLLFSLSLTATELQIQVLATTDTHGSILPADPFTQKTKAQGWAKLATLIRQMKARQPHTLLLDCGDSIQGDPINYICHRLRPELPDPSMAIMNDLGYHAMAMGNHELDWGMENAKRAAGQAKFPWLCANLVEKSTGNTPFAPYLVLNVSGVKVGLLGLCTSTLVQYLEPEWKQRYQVEDAIQCAERMIPKLRTQEKAEVVIVLYHGGPGALNATAGEEDQGLAMLDRVPGIDLILGGHTHNQINTQHKGIPFLIPGIRGEALAVAQIQLKKEKHGWRVLKREGQLLELPIETPEDPKVLSLTEKLRNLTDNYLDTYATELQVDLDGRWGRMEDTTPAQLLHAVQLRATGAQLSAISAPSMKYFVPKGPTSVRQFFALVPYEDRIARIRITGKQLRLWLEHSAQAYNFSHHPELFTKLVPRHHFDTIYGVNYTLDLSKPLGSRVWDLKYAGEPVREDQVFTMAITTFRLAGGSGYMDAIGFKGSAEMVHKEGLRNLLLDYVLSQPRLNVPLTRHWRTVPSLERQRVLNEAF